MSFIPITRSDEEEMLEAIGAKRIEDLFSSIPASKRFPKLRLPEPLSELEVLREMSRLASRNADSDSLAWFLGAGAYNHFIPSVVSAIASRGEFLTAYTPYQPEVSQGTLQAIFEYQSMAGKLLGMPVVNASHYDGATALAEAALMAWKHTGRNKVALPSDIHPEYRAVLDTYLSSFDLSVIEYEGDPSSCKVDGETACLVAGYPTYSGEVYDLSNAARKAHDEGALFIILADPLMCAIMKSPGELGADIVAAEGQPLGIPMNFGGPFLGMMGATEALMRKMPGRIVGEAKDHDGRRGFVLTLTAREQHIRREKAVSNICSNQGLTMLQACVHMAAMGPEGLKSAARLSYDKAHYAASLIGKIPGFSVLNKAFFKEFLVSTPIAAETVFSRLRKKGIVPGFPLSRYESDRAGELLICVTEMNTRREIDALAAALAEATR